MNEKYKRFYEEQESDNTKKVVKSLQSIGEYDYTNCTIEDLERIILETKPKSFRAIIINCSILGKYLKFLGNEEAYNMIKELNRDKLWESAKSNVPQKFISNITFNEVFDDISKFEECNNLITATLWRAVYEGIYCDDMSVLKNLRASDVHEDTVILHNDNGQSYELKISKELANDLKEVATVNSIERMARYGKLNLVAKGLYYDSCFKIAQRKDNNEDEGYRFAYYRTLRKICNDYVEYRVLPLELFISGIMHRIKLELDKHDILLEEAFAKNNKSRVVNKIIEDEIKRCNYNTEVRAFRQTVQSYLEVFTK